MFFLLCNVYFPFLVACPCLLDPLLFGPDYVDQGILGLRSRRRQFRPTRAGMGTKAVGENRENEVYGNWRHSGMERC